MSSLWFKALFWGLRAQEQNDWTKYLGCLVFVEAWELKDKTIELNTGYV